VSGVSTQAINELKSYRKPTAKIQLALESVVCLLKNGTKKLDWDKEVMPTIKKDDFVSSILNFQKEKITPKCREYLVKNYLNDPMYDIQGFYRASKSLGPLTDWCKSIIEYADIFESIGPKRKELADLESESLALEERFEELKAEIAELTKKKIEMQEKYQQLVAELNNIENE
jgi:hypothetical protein